MPQSNKAPAQPFAVFDIDGTLYRWQLFHELIKELTDRGVISGQQHLDQHWNAWRGGEISFRDYEHALLKDVLFKNLAGLDCKDFDEAAKAVIKNSGHRTNRYVQNLLESLQAKGYQIIAISGSQQELLDHFCARYGFDVAIGAMYERRNGRFTGQVSRNTFDNKAAILNELVKARGLDFAGSLAIGDSGSDIAILELVEQPIAFNPSVDLLERARQDGWPVVIERKNLAYKLEKSGDTFVLAETIVL